MSSKTVLVSNVGMCVTNLSRRFGCQTKQKMCGICLLLATTKTKQNTSLGCWLFFSVFTPELLLNENAACYKWCLCWVFIQCSIKAFKSLQRVIHAAANSDFWIGVDSFSLIAVFRVSCQFRLLRFAFQPTYLLLWESACLWRIDYRNRFERHLKLSCRPVSN